MNFRMRSVYLTVKKDRLNPISEKVNDWIQILSGVLWDYQ